MTLLVGQVYLRLQEIFQNYHAPYEAKVTRIDLFTANISFISNQLKGNVHANNDFVGDDYDDVLPQTYLNIPSPSSIRTPPSPLGDIYSDERTLLEGLGPYIVGTPSDDSYTETQFISPSLPNTISTCPPVSPLSSSVAAQHDQGSLATGTRIASAELDRISSAGQSSNQDNTQEGGARESRSSSVVIVADIRASKKRRRNDHVKAGAKRSKRFAGNSRERVNVLGSQIIHHQMSKCLKTKHLLPFV